jgi:hypothetical protein
MMSSPFQFICRSHICRFTRLVSTCLFYQNQDGLATIENLHRELSIAMTIDSTLRERSIVMKKEGVPKVNK